MLTPHLRRIRRDLAAKEALSAEERSLLHELESLDQALAPEVFEAVSDKVMRGAHPPTERCPCCGR